MHSIQSNQAPILPEVLPQRTSMDVSQSRTLDQIFNTKKGSSEYYFLVTQALAAVASFCAQDLSKFGLDIGESAYHLQTVKILSLARSKIVRKEMKEFAKSAALVQNLSQEIISQKNKRVKESANATLPVLKMSPDVTYLVQASLLTAAQGILPSTQEKSSYLCAQACVGLHKLSEKTLSRERTEIIHGIIHQELVIASSIITDAQAAQIRHPVTPIIRMDLTGTIVDAVVQGLPMFDSYKVLIETCLKDSIPIVLKVKLCATDCNGTRQVGTEIVALGDLITTVKDQNPLFCLFECVRQDPEANARKVLARRNSILLDDNRECIYKGAADHPQYAKTIKTITTLEQVDKLRNLIVIAGSNEIGTSQEDRSLCFVQHVYPQSKFSLLNKDG